MRTALGLALFFLATPLWAQSGLYTPQVDSSGSPPGYVISPGPDAAIPWNSANIVEWASAVANYSPSPSVSASFDPDNMMLSPSRIATLWSYAVGPTQSHPNAASPNLGSPVNDVISLGEDGSITVTFTSPIANGPGNDFAVFSNGFLGSGADGWPDAYSKFATVSVSSDGVHFFSFPDNFDSFNGGSLIGGEYFNASYLYNIAGKYVYGFGTPFDLNELAGVSPLLNINEVTQVRITDAWDTNDSNGNPILDDPESTVGFNFAGAAVLNDVASVPEPSTWIMAAICFLPLVWFRRCALCMVRAEY